MNPDERKNDASPLLMPDADEGGAGPSARPEELANTGGFATSDRETDEGGTIAGDGEDET